MYCLFGFLISVSLTNTGLAQSRGRVAAGSLRTNVEDRFEQIIYTFTFVPASSVTKSNTRKWFRLSRGGSVTAPLQRFAKLAVRKPHRIGWTAKRIIHVWDKFPLLVGISRVK